MGDQPEAVREPLVIRPYPARDTDFASHVAEAVDTARSVVAGDDELGEMVQQRLRQVYPNAVVRIQQPLARLLDPAGAVYAFRDGSIEPEDLREDMLQRAEAEPGAETSHESEAAG